MKATEQWQSSGTAGEMHSSGEATAGKSLWWDAATPKAALGSDVSHMVLPMPLLIALPRGSLEVCICLQTHAALWVHVVSITP